MATEVGFTRRAALVAAAALLMTIGCSKSSTEGGAGLSSMVNMADPTASRQLKSGFHAVESNSWRWTMKKFSLDLKPPAGSEQTGATLRVRLFIPDGQFAELGPITLSADVDGHALPSQTFSKAGDSAYSQPVPADLLKGPSVRVNFSLDKAQPGDAQDGRERGVVVSVIGLQPK